MSENPIEYIFNEYDQPMMARELVGFPPYTGEIYVYLTETEWENVKYDETVTYNDTYEEILNRWKNESLTGEVFYYSAIDLNREARRELEDGKEWESNLLKARAKKAVRDSLTLVVNENYNPSDIAKNMILLYGDETPEKVQNNIQREIDLDKDETTNFWIEVRNIVNKIFHDEKEGYV